MDGSKQSFYNDGEILERNREVFVTTSATLTTYAMSVYEQVLRIILVSSNALAVTLPSVAEARGKMYSIRITTDGGAAATIDDKGDDAALTQIALTDDEDGVILYSDGRNWWVMATSGLLATDYD